MSLVGIAARDAFVGAIPIVNTGITEGCFESFQYVAEIFIDTLKLTFRTIIILVRFSLAALAVTIFMTAAFILFSNPCNKGHVL